MDTYETRRHNLQALMDRVYGIGARGAKSKLAKRLDKQPDYISRCLYPPEKPGRKNIGEEFARQIEDAYELDRYALDQETIEQKLTELTKQNKTLIVQHGNGSGKTNTYLLISQLLEQIYQEKRSERTKFIKDLRDEIAHASVDRLRDEHRSEKLIYAIGSAAADKVLTNTELQILEAAVLSISARYELVEAEEKLAEYRKMGFSI